MPDQVIVTVKFKVNRSEIEDFKQELSDVIEEFMDSDIAEQDGEMEVSEIQ